MDKTEQVRSHNTYVGRMICTTIWELYVNTSDQLDGRAWSHEIMLIHQNISI